jgi:hypothetical protein
MTKENQGNSTDDGPRFLSDLIREFAHLKNQQISIEKKIQEFIKENNFIVKRIDAIEGTLRAIGVREGDLATDFAKAEGRKIGQRNILALVGVIVVPISIAFMAWFIPATLNAIKHSTVEEERWRLEDLRNPPPQFGPELPPRFQPKQP